MAYFSALGGTGGTSATITVTYSEDFYGVTITATNGTTTLTKTATSSGTLTFDVSEGGTWIVSGTVEGATYSEQVDVFFEYTVPPLVALPDGSTALPVNDIQMWLKCAGIRDKTTYTTLADVLADTDTFIALCADSNACNYMARSTNWASGVAADSTAMLIVGKYNYCANKLLSDSTWAEAICNSTYIDSVLNIKVPTMTSATAPSGTVDSNGDYGSGYDKWRAFNPSESQGWVPNHGGAQAGYYLVGDWLSYDFGYSVCISYVELSYINTSTPNNIYFKIQGSNDNFVSDIHDLCSEQTITGVASTTVTTKVALGNATNYAKHRVYISTNSSSSGGKGLKVQFYGRTEKGYTGTVIHSAVEDTTYYMEGGQSVPFCTIASGDTETVLASTIESLKNQTITLYSSVAKDPTNLSNDYSKSIRITPNVTEIYLMPDKCLYWFGHFDNECEIMSSANGWGGGVTYNAPTLNKNNVAGSSADSNHIVGIASKSLITFSKMHFISKMTSGWAVAMGTALSKVGSSDNNVTNNATVDTYLYGTVTSGNYYLMAKIQSTVGNIYALWYE